MVYSYEGKSPVIHETAFVSESATLIGDVRIGACCYIGANCVIRADVSPVVVGAYTNLQDAVVVHVDKKGMVIGERVSVGHSAILHGRSIGNNCGIGMGAILSGGSVIGEGSIVAEGALVRSGQEIAENVVVGGVPAKYLRDTEERDRQYWRGANNSYVELAKKCNEGALVRLT